jgi:hypothetical protein
MNNEPTKKMFDEFQENILQIIKEIEKLKQKEFTDKAFIIISLEEKLQKEQELFDKFRNTWCSVFPEQKRDKDFLGYVKLNIGGKKLSLKVPNFSCFSSETNSVALLLNSARSKYFLKDKDERIYFDYEKNWFEPILRKTIKDESSLVFLLPAPQETRLLEEVFQLSGRAQYCEVQLTDIFQQEFSFSVKSEILSSFVGEVWKRSQTVLEKSTLVKVYSSNNLLLAVDSCGVKFNKPRDCLIIFQTGQGEVYCCFTDGELLANKPVNTPRTILFRCNDGKIWGNIDRNYESELKKATNSIFPLALFSATHVVATRQYGYTFPYLRISKGEPCSFTIFPAGGECKDLTEDTYDCVLSTWLKIIQLQIYHVNEGQCGSINLLKRKFEENKQHLISLNQTFHSNEKLIETIQPVLFVMNEIVTVQQLLDELSAEMVEMQTLFLEFAKFAIKHFTSLWSFAGIKADASPSMDSDDEVIDRLQKIISSIDTYKSICKEESLVKKNSELDPIVYLSVEGERICILKSTLQEMIPTSQLSIRLASGRWEEPEENIDEDGNIIIKDIPGPVFERIVEGIRRGKLMNEKQLIIQVSDENQKQIMTKYLDFLAIENYRFSFF